MYGLIGKMTTHQGQRDQLISLLLKSTVEMPGCLSYVIAEDPAEPDAIWITEVWDNEASWSAALQMPEVQAAIADARPLIAGMGPRTITMPVGGTGLPR